MQDLQLCPIQEGTFELRGHLHDSTDLSMLDDKLRAQHRLKLSKLYSVTWIGLSQLLDKLALINDDIILDEIPLHLFCILVVMPKFGRFRCGSIVFDSRKLGAGSLLQPILYSELVLLAERSGVIGYFEDGEPIPVPLNHLCYTLGPKGRAGLTFNIVQSESHKFPLEFFSFLSNYFWFCSRVLQSSVMSIHAATVLIDESMQRITTRASTFEAAIKVINRNFSGGKVRELFKILPFIRKISGDAEEAVRGAWNQVAQTAAEYHHWLVVGKFDNTEKIRAIIRDFSKHGQILIEITGQIEKIGSTLGEKVLTCSQISKICEPLFHFEADKMNESDVRAVRRKLGFDEGITDWHSVLRLVENVSASLSDDVEKCIVALQSFDLVRQVLEHRITEIGIIGKATDGELSDLWSDIKSSVLMAAFAKLVTDQEKLIFQYFFSDFQSEDCFHRQMSAKQGEIILF